MSRSSFARTPSTLRHANLDNLAIVPGSLLPFKAEWQQVANSLPIGSILICLPAADTPQRKALETVAALLKAHGHQVTTLPADRFR